MRENYRRSQDRSKISTYNALSSYQYSLSSAFHQSATYLDATGTETQVSRNNFGYSRSPISTSAIAIVFSQSAPPTKYVHRTARSASPVLPPYQQNPPPPTTPTATRNQAQIPFKFKITHLRHVTRCIKSLVLRRQQNSAWRVFLQPSACCRGCVCMCARGGEGFHVCSYILQCRLSLTD